MSAGGKGGPGSAAPLVLWGRDDGAPQRLELGPLELVWFASKDPGKDVSQDALFALEVPDGRVAVGVLDGMGGMENGGTAARIGVELLAEAAAAVVGEESLRAALVGGVERAHGAVRERVPGGGATVVAASLSATHCQFVHAGDAEGLQFSQRGTLRQRTVAHSPVGYAEAAGALTEAEALAHPERHFVASGLGVEGMTMQVGPREALRPRDTVLLASDGLTDNLFEHEIVERLCKGPLMDGVANLAALARARMAEPMAGPGGFPIGKPDDLTIVALRRRRSPGLGPKG